MRHEQIFKKDFLIIFFDKKIPIGIFDLGANMFPDIREIKKKRKMLGLTQKELAKLSDVSQSLITKIEKGTINPSYGLVIKIFDTLHQLEGKSSQKAEEIMSSPLISVSPDDPLIKATKIMERKAFSQLPVIDKGSCIGSISEQTILKLVTKSIEEKEGINSIVNKRVKEVMSEPFPIVSPSTPLQILSSLLQFTPAVLVNVGGKLTGIITRSDLFKILKS